MKSGLIFCILIYFSFAFFSLDQVPVADEIFDLSAARTINAGDLPRDPYGDYDLPLCYSPTYLYALALTARLGQFPGVAAKITGMFCFLACLILIYAISRELFKDNKKSYLVALGACLLYSISPLVIQGSLLLDAEGTTLAVALLLFIFFFVKAPEVLNGKQLISLGILFAVSLWAKQTTPLALIPSIALFYFTNGEYKKGLRYALTSFFIGAGLFVATWWLYCHLLQASFWLPFAYFEARGRSMMVQGDCLNNLFTILRAVWKLNLWVSPFFLVLAALAIGSRIRLFGKARKFSKLDFLAILGVLIFTAYLVTGRLCYGFPRYHIVTIPVFAMLIAGFIASKQIALARKTWLILGFAIPVVIAYNVLFIGDLLYSTDYLVKQSLITGSPSLRSVLSEGIARFLLYLLPLLLYLAILKLSAPKLKLLNRIIIALLAMAISANFSLNILQAGSDYHTRYYYGGRDTQKVIDFVN
ncbi:MAG: glycosyltransferase family 39 protein, partial [Candidatus Omnitrophica bacterium]|nr:glycosyltransferase family 39 protein [Candidatus Omnitrophota bacterium]